MLQEFWRKLTSDGQSRGEYSEGLRVSAVEEEAEEDLRRKGVSPGWGEVGGSMSFNTLGGLVLLLGSEDLGAHGGPGKNTGVGCRFLLQGIFPTQESNLGLLHCKQILHHLSHREASRDYNPSFKSFYILIFKKLYILRFVWF